MAIPVLVGVGVLTVAILAVLLVALLRHVRALSESLARLQADLIPALEDIRAGSEVAQERLGRLEARAAAMRREHG
jgi:cell division protein FtsB